MKKKQGITVGYTVVNFSPIGYRYMVVCDEEGEVYPSYTEARKERDRLRNEYGNEYIHVVAVRQIPDQ